MQTICVDSSSNTELDQEHTMEKEYNRTEALQVAELYRPKSGTLYMMRYRDEIEPQFPATSLILQPFQNFFGENIRRSCIVSNKEMEVFVAAKEPLILTLSIT